MTLARHTLLILALLASGSRAQKGSPYRCRNREPNCAQWASQQECDKNPEFMLDKCPVACDVCSNAKLDPTPAPFEFDFTCHGKLATAPLSFQGTPEDDAPNGCAFRCADKMSEKVCKQALEKGACSGSQHAKAARFNCAATCNICSAIGMPVSPATNPLPKCTSEKDASKFCEGWAEKGECISNFDYMSESCARACGLCADDGQIKISMDAARRKSKATTASSTAKKPKKKKGTSQEGSKPTEEIPSTSSESGASTASTAASAEVEQSPPVSTGSADSTAPTSTSAAPTSTSAGETASSAAAAAASAAKATPSDAESAAAASVESDKQDTSPPIDSKPEGTSTTAQTETKRSSKQRKEKQKKGFGAAVRDVLSNIPGFRKKNGDTKEEL